MKSVVSVVFIIASILTSVNLFAEETKLGEAPAVTGRGTPLTEEEMKVGRYGDVDEVPDDFKFNDAEVKLWLSDHLGNIKKPVSLYYEFVKSGSFEEGFTDSVYLKILELNEDGTKNAALDFFTAEKKQAVTPDNVTNIIGNPVLGIFLQGDVYEMGRLTEGHWRYFHKQLKVALREAAVIEPTTFDYNGKEYNGEKIYFSPYLEDPHRRDFEKYAEKYYEFIFSDQIPGSLYQIKTVIPDKSKENNEPLILETLTLMDVK
ncbi:MAG: hypothetical protein HND53_01850 [Proteobacteria bacterium]|nr:hypothetical protein [Pseudomonadota bacterium]NOG59214.1 hypothetical protein [Pseudomonadota bacterium]